MYGSVCLAQMVMEEGKTLLVAYDGDFSRLGPKV